MAKRRSSSGKAAPRKAPVKRGAAGSIWRRPEVLGATFGAVCGIILFIWTHLTPREVDEAKPPKPVYPVVTLQDSPGVAMDKSHARYLLNFADSLEDFAKRADTFQESGDAAKWFAERTAKARKDAYAGDGGFDAYVFGHAGGTDSGEDRYDAKQLAAGALEMARASREAAKAIAGQR